MHFVVFSLNVLGYQSQLILQNSNSRSLTIINRKLRVYPLFLLLVFATNFYRAPTEDRPRCVGSRRQRSSCSLPQFGTISASDPIPLKTDSGVLLIVIIVRAGVGRSFRRV